MSDEETSRTAMETRGEKPESSGRAFTSILMGIFGCLLLAGSVGLHAYYLKQRDALENPKKQPEQANTNTVTQTDNSLKGIEKFARENVEFFQSGRQQGMDTQKLRIWLWFSGGLALLAGILGLVGLIQGILAIKMDGPPRTTAGFGSFFSFIAFLGIFFSGYNTIVGLQVMEKQADLALDMGTNLIDGVYGKAFEIADDIGGKLTVNNNREIIKGENHEGTMAPELNVSVINRSNVPEFRLSEQRGVRPVLLVFLSTRAIPCQDIIERLKQLDAKTDPAELLIVAVSKTEPLETLRANVASKGIKFRTGKPFSNLEPPYTDAVAPTIFTIDINGKFRDIIIGEEDVKKTNLDRLVGRLRQIKRDK